MRLASFTSLVSWILLVVSAEICRPNLTDLLATDDRLDAITYRIILQLGLGDVLARNGPFTVFAPATGSFEPLGGQMGISLVPEDRLMEILQYHFVWGNHSLDSIEKEGSLETVLEAPISFERDETGNIYIAEEGIEVGEKIDVCNGIIYMIDGVLIPPVNLTGSDLLEPTKPGMEGTPLEFLQSDTRFGLLTAALLNSKVSKDLDGTLLTLFAPTNGAFERLMGSMNITMEDFSTSDELKQILLYHLVQGLQTEPVLQNGEGLTTLHQGRVVTVFKKKGTIFLSNGADIITPVVEEDVAFKALVIHVIEDMLLPRDCFDVQPLSVGPQAFFNCSQQKEFRKCRSEWMLERDWCARTCGRCNS